MNFAEIEGNIYGIANASNAVAFDYSANHLYAESFNYGKKSLNTALEGIRCIAENTKGICFARAAKFICSDITHVVLDA